MPTPPAALPFPSPSQARRQSLDLSTPPNSGSPQRRHPDSSSLLPSIPAAPPAAAEPGPRAAALRRLREDWEDAGNERAASGPARSAEGAGGAAGACESAAACCGSVADGAGGSNDGATSAAAASDDVIRLPDPLYPLVPSAAANGADGCAAAAAARERPAAGGSGQLTLVAGGRAGLTESMVAVLSDEIRRSRASCSLELSFMSDLTLVGGFCNFEL